MNKLFICQAVFFAFLFISGCGGDENEFQNAYENSAGGLLWSSKMPGHSDWFYAERYCEALSEQGFKDWRLPTVDELRTLIRNCEVTETGGTCKVSEKCLAYTDCRNSSCDGCEYDGLGKYSILGDSRMFWSSSVTSENNLKVWYVNFDYGEINSTFKTASDNVNYTRCVRQN